MSALSLHHTHTYRIQDSTKEGWEFRCPHCSYRTRYITKNGSGPRRLEIIDGGDADARHTSTFPENSFDSGWIQDELCETDRYDEDDFSLPVHLQQQIEEILKRANTDGWMT